MKYIYANDNKFDILSISDSDTDSNSDTLCISNIDHISYIKDVTCYGITIFYILFTFYLYFGNLFLAFFMFIFFAVILRKHIN